MFGARTTDPGQRDEGPSHSVSGGLKKKILFFSKNALSMEALVQIEQARSVRQNTSFFRFLSLLRSLRQWREACFEMQIKRFQVRIGRERVLRMRQSKRVENREHPGENLGAVQMRTQERELVRDDERKHATSNRFRARLRGLLDEFNHKCGLLQRLRVRGRQRGQEHVAVPGEKEPYGGDSGLVKDAENAAKTAAR